MNKNEFRQRLVDDWLNEIITTTEFEAFKEYWLGLEE